MAIQQRSLIWTALQNPVMGKIKLQSMEHSKVFYESWLQYIQLDAGLNDTASLFPVSPYTLNKNTTPTKVDVPSETTMVCIHYRDTYGDLLKKDIAYSVKIFMWVETTEDAKGIEFDFQKEAKTI